MQTFQTLERKKAMKKEKQKKKKSGNIYIYSTLVLGIKTFLGIGNPAEAAYS